MAHTLALRVLALSLVIGIASACAEDEADTSSGASEPTPVDDTTPDPADPAGGAGAGAVDPGDDMMGGTGLPTMGEDMMGDEMIDDPTLGGTRDCEGFILDEGTFTVPPGGDVNYCVRLPIPEEYRDVDLALQGWNWDLSNTHHYFMEHSPMPHPDPEAGVVPCSPDGSQQHFSLLGSTNTEGATLAFGAGEGVGFTTTREGYGKYLPKGGHFRTSHHVINFTDEPIEIGAKFKVCVGRADETPHLMNSFVCVQTAINVPGASGSATHTCTAREPIDMIGLASHAHQHLTRFTMQYYDGTKTHDELIYESFDWDSPELVALDEPLHLERGQGITYTCHYDGTGPVFFQDSAKDPRAEHCGAFLGYAYPKERAGEVPPRIFSLAIFPNQVVEAVLSLPGSPI